MRAWVSSARSVQATREQGEQSTGIVGVEHGKRSDHHQKSDAGEADPVLRHEHAGAALSRLSLHDVGVLGVDAERERGRSVGDQVDPKQLDGEQRQEQSGVRRDKAEHARKHHACEHREQFAGIGRQQIDQVLLDIVVDPRALPRLP